MPESVKPDAAAVNAATVTSEVLERQCGRCRKVFPAEPGADARSVREWWACLACHAALFPSKAGHAGVG